jgi:hypothetical protein
MTSFRSSGIFILGMCLRLPASARAASSAASLRARLAFSLTWANDERRAILCLPLGLSEYFASICNSENIELACWVSAGCALRGEGCTYSAARDLLVAALAGDLEGNIVGSVAFDLEGTSREMVEVLVDQLDIQYVVSDCDNLRSCGGVEGARKCRSRK